MIPSGRWKWREPGGRRCGPGGNRPQGPAVNVLRGVIGCTSSTPTGAVGEYRLNGPPSVNQKGMFVLTLSSHWDLLKDEKVRISFTPIQVSRRAVVPSASSNAFLGLWSVKLDEEVNQS
jgi:hypothetical protein